MSHIAHSGKGITLQKRREMVLFGWEPTWTHELYIWELLHIPLPCCFTGTILNWVTYLRGLLWNTWVIYHVTLLEELVNFKIKEKPAHVFSHIFYILMPVSFPSTRLAVRFTACSQNHFHSFILPKLSCPFSSLSRNPSCYQINLGFLQVPLKASLWGIPQSHLHFQGICYGNPKGEGMDFW